MELSFGKPGMPGADREEGRVSRSPSSRGDIAVIRLRKIGAGPEEDWSFLGTGDPAFWLKEPDRD